VVEDERPKFIIGFKTPYETGSFDAISEFNLEYLSITHQDIARTSSFFSFPGNLYPESGVASLTHPCAGSVGIELFTNDGKRAMIEYIFYHDLNPNQTHAEGKQHWNLEMRFTHLDGTIDFPVKSLVDKTIPHHQIRDSNEIEIFIETEDGIKSKTIKKVVS